MMKEDLTGTIAPVKTFLKSSKIKNHQNQLVD